MCPGDLAAAIAVVAAAGDTDVEFRHGVCLNYPAVSKVGTFSSNTGRQNKN
jgi:hypothetical protein